eukprot:jgi/Hompol1/1952/HPOL_005807-RA
MLPSWRSQPRDPSGLEFWELYDETHKLPYFYNTRTKQTEWVRPAVGTIIPGSPSASPMRTSAAAAVADPRMPTPPKDAAVYTSLSALSASGRTSTTGAGADAHGADLSARAASEASLGGSVGYLSRSTPNAAAVQIAKAGDINQFKIDGFAKKYFSQHRRGFFRRKVPIEKMLVYQKDALRMPLMQLRPDLHRDATKCFKLLQKIMQPKGDFSTCYPEIQALLETGIRVGGLRDEIFVQLCKQLTENPSADSVKKGWQLMDIVCSTFPPSKNLENYLKSFLQQNFNAGGQGSELDMIVRHASASLIRIGKIGPRGRTMTPAEIDQVLEAPFKNSVFGDTLDSIMERQLEAYPGLELPRILLFLTDAILKLNGAQAEGIFRVPGDAEAVSGNQRQIHFILCIRCLFQPHITDCVIAFAHTLGCLGFVELRCRIDKDEYDYTGFTDPNVPGSLFKLWLRELSDPLIPAEHYPQCVSVGQEDRRLDQKELYEKATGIVEQLPEINRRVVRFTIQFLQIIAEPQNQPFTKMTVANLAMVFAPNFLRCPSDNPTTIFENTK